MGLGDVIERALSTVGITEEVVTRWLGRPCGCRERKEKLNALSAWAKRVAAGKIAGAVDWFRGIVSGDEEVPVRRKLPDGLTLLSETTLIHMGLRIHELVGDWGNGNHELIWLRASATPSQDLASYVIPDGLTVANPLIHIGYGPDVRTEEAARLAVRMTFDKHWGLA